MTNSQRRNLVQGCNRVFADVASGGVQKHLSTSGSWLSAGVSEVNVSRSFLVKLTHP